MAMEARDVAARGMTFQVLVDGPEHGEPVVLLHGFPQSAREWDAQLPALAAAGFRAIAPDQRGYSPGARPTEIDAYARDELVDDVLAIADALGIERFHVVGHDWGGFVAWSLAWARPERVRTLTAVSVPHPAAFAAAYEVDAEQQAKSVYLDWFRADGHEPEATMLAGDAAGLRAAFEGAVPAESVDAYVEQHREPGALTAALAWYRAMVPGSFVGTLGSVQVPTLYVWSDADIALGRVAAERTGDHVTGPYRFEVLRGVTHWIPEQAPDELNRLLLEHLASAST
jgi:pimeloyl-ACP methyl ester carboxylesterase